MGDEAHRCRYHATPASVRRHWRAVALVLVAALATAQPAVSDNAVWNDFTAWIQKQQPNSKPSELIDSYRRHLLAEGLPESEAGRRMRIISNDIFTRRPGVELLWDKVYAGKDPIFLRRPSGVVVRAVEVRTPGKALDIGMGQGRNSIYLAARGWDVTGFDPSSQAVRLARANAVKAGVRLQALVARDDEFDYGEGQWDLILMTYVRDLNEADADRFWKALKPGGIVVYENGVSENNAVLRAFLRYQVVLFEDVLTTPDWNPQNRMRVQRMIAARFHNPR